MTESERKKPGIDKSAAQLPLDILLGLYAQQNSGLKHHEVQRATITNLVVVVAGATLGLYHYVPDPLVKNLLAVFVIVLGAFGAVLSAKHFQLSTRHGALAREYRRKMEAANGSCAIEYERITRENERAYPRLSKLSLWWLWVTFHLFIAGLGSVLLFSNLTS